MNEADLKKLKKELKDEGALENEADDLALFSKNLSNLYSFKRSESLKTKFLNQSTKNFNKNYFSKKIFASAFLSVLLLLGFVSVVSAQKSLPGQRLYPLKIASENIISALDPSFKSEILKRRSEEIKQLSGENNSNNLKNAVKDYQEELDHTKKISPKQIVETKKNLEDAQKNTTQENKKEIENAIIQTQNKQEEIQNSEVKGTFIAPTGTEIKTNVENKIQNVIEGK